MSNQFALDLTLDALGDPMRRRILESLSNGPTPVGQLAAALPIGRPAVSRHLRVLTMAGLVEHTSRGTRNLYALAPEGQRELQQWLVGLWDGALASFAEYVAAHPDQKPDQKPDQTPGQHADQAMIQHPPQRSTRKPAGDSR